MFLLALMSGTQPQPKRGLSNSLTGMSVSLDYIWTNRATTKYAKTIEFNQKMPAFTGRKFGFEVCAAYTLKKSH